MATAGATGSVPDGAPDVTVVIVAHSARAELERCLGSIDAHADRATQVVLVDNASEDDTREWVRRVHPQVELVELDSNVGVAARRHGVDRARGRYTMFLDSDAALTAGALPLMVQALDDHPGWGLIGPRLVGDDGSLQLSCRRFPPLLLPIMRRPPFAALLEDSAPVRRHLMADEDHTRTRPVLYVLGACQLFRTALARRAGPPDTRTFLGADDIDWCLRIRDAGGDVVYLPAATVIHSYQRRTRRNPFSRATLRHLTSFLRFQWRYRSRRRELIRLQSELDRRAAAPGT